MFQDISNLIAFGVAGRGTSPRCRTPPSSRARVPPSRSRHSTRRCLPHGGAGSRKAASCRTPSRTHGSCRARCSPPPSRGCRRARPALPASSARRGVRAQGRRRGCNLSPPFRPASDSRSRTLRCAPASRSPPAPHKASGCWGCPSDPPRCAPKDVLPPD